MSKFRLSPRALNLRPDRLDSRLRVYAEGIKRASSAAVVGFSNRGAPGVAPLDEFQIVTESTNHVACRRRGEPTLDLVHVMKPYDLQGFVQTRTFGAETHHITPGYGVGGFLLAERVPGGVGWSASDGPYTWVDLNVDARQWAKEAT